MQVTGWAEVSAGPRTGRHEVAVGPVARAAAVSREAAEAVEALFGLWEVQLEASLHRLSSLQGRLDAQARRLSGLESELASLRPAAAGSTWGATTR